MEILVVWKSATVEVTVIVTVDPVGICVVALVHP